jgi:hypothetical protein
MAGTSNRDLIARIKLIADSNSANELLKLFEKIDLASETATKNSKKRLQTYRSMFESVITQLEQLQKTALSVGSSATPAESAKYNEIVADLVKMAQSADIVNGRFKITKSIISDIATKTAELQNLFSGRTTTNGAPAIEATSSASAQPENVVEGEFKPADVQQVTEGTAALEAAAQAGNTAAQSFTNAGDSFTAMTQAISQQADYVKQIADQMGGDMESALKTWREIVTEDGKISGIDPNKMEDAVRSKLGMGPTEGGTSFSGEAVADAAKKASNEVTSLNSALVANQKQTKAATNTWSSFSAAFAGFQLRFVGEQIGRFGKQLLTPITDYVKYAGAASEASAKWGDATSDITKSISRIGKTMIEEALPALEAAAKAASQIASVFEKNPLLAKALVGLAGGSMAIGAILSLAGTLLTGVAALKYIVPALFSTGSASAAAAAGGAASSAAATGGSILSGIAGSAAVTAIAGVVVSVIAYGAVAAAVIALATAAYKGIAGTEFGKSRNMEAAPGQALALGALGLGQIIGGKSLAEDWFLKVAKLTGAVKDLGNASEEATDKLGPSTEAIDAYISYMQSVKDAEQQYQDQRSNIVKDADKQRADEDQNYAKQSADNAKQINDLRNQQAEADKQAKSDELKRAEAFAKSERRAYEDYYIQRNKDARDYNIEVQRAEEDHQREMRRMLEDHNLKVQNLLGEQDAFGLLAESQSFEKDRRQKEEEYTTETKRRSEDFAIKLSDMEQQFQLERARAWEDFNQEQADAVQQRKIERARQLAELADKQKQLDEEHKQNLAKIDADEKEKLAQLDKEHAQELTKLQNDFADKLRLLDANLLNERNTRIAYYTQMSKDLQSWLSSMSGQVGSNLPGYPKRAMGGYTPHGLYELGEGGKTEWVANNATMHTLESAVQGSLTQENVQRLATHTGGNITVEQNFRFNGSFSESEKQWFRSVAREEAYNGVKEVLS